MTNSTDQLHTVITSLNITTSLDPHSTRVFYFLFISRLSLVLDEASMNDNLPVCSKHKHSSEQNYASDLRLDLVHPSRQINHNILPPVSIQVHTGKHWRLHGAPMEMHQARNCWVDRLYKDSHSCNAVNHDTLTAFARILYSIENLQD